MVHHKCRQSFEYSNRKGEKSAKKGGSPYTDNNLGKSNQNQRNEVDFILDALKTMQDELKKKNT